MRVCAQKLLRNPSSSLFFFFFLQLRRGRCRPSIRPSIAFAAAYVTASTTCTSFALSRARARALACCPIPANIELCRRSRVCQREGRRRASVRLTCLCRHVHAQMQSLGLGTFGPLQIEAMGRAVTLFVMRARCNAPRPRDAARKLLTCTTLRF